MDLDEAQSPRFIEWALAYLVEHRTGHSRDAHQLGSLHERRFAHLSLVFDQLGLNLFLGGILVHDPDITRTQGRTPTSP